MDTTRRSGGWPRKSSSPSSRKSPQCGWRSANRCRHLCPRRPMTFTQQLDPKSGRQPDHGADDMKRPFDSGFFTGCDDLAGDNLPWPDKSRRRHRSRHTDQPSRSRLLRGAVLEHGLCHRSSRQQAPRHDPSRRSAAGQFQSALQRPIAGAWPGVFARSSHHCRRRDRLECREFHRYRDQCRQARHLCRALSARGVLYAWMARKCG